MAYGSSVKGLKKSPADEKRSRDLHSPGHFGSGHGEATSCESKVLLKASLPGLSVIRGQDRRSGTTCITGLRRDRNWFRERVFCCRIVHNSVLFSDSLYLKSVTPIFASRTEPQAAFTCNRAPFVVVGLSASTPFSQKRGKY